MNYQKKILFVKRLKIGYDSNHLGGKVWNMRTTECYRKNEIPKLQKFYT